MPDDDGNLEQAVRKTKGGFFSTERIFMIFLLVIGFIAGLYIEHAYVEPMLSGTLGDQLNECRTSNSLLNQEIEQSLQQQAHNDSNSPQ